MISNWKGNPSELNINDQTLIRRLSFPTKLYAFPSFFHGNTIHEFDVGLCQWKDVPLPNGLKNPQAILVSDVDQLIFIGGYPKHACAQSFNTNSGEIGELAPMLSSKKAFSADIVGKEIFVFGGIDEDSFPMAFLSTAEK